MRALGAGTEAAPEPEIILGQFVTLVKDGKVVRISKRTGNVIALADILDEVDPDVARLTFLLQGIDTTQTFDLDVVTQQSMENPVYYVQYAHARVASIGAQGRGRRRHASPARRRWTSGCSRTSASWSCSARSPTTPTCCAHAAELRAPHRVTTWVRDFASRFHGFYRDCPRAHRRRRRHPGAALAGGGEPRRPRRARSPSSA